MNRVTPSDEDLWGLIREDASHGALTTDCLDIAEHQRFIHADPEVWIPMLAARCPAKRIVVEVLTHDEGLCAAASGADVIQLATFTPGAVRRFGSGRRFRR